MTKLNAILTFLLTTAVVSGCVALTLLPLPNSSAVRRLEMVCRFGTDRPLVIALVCDYYNSSGGSK